MQSNSTHQRNLGLYAAAAVGIAGTAAYTSYKYLGKSDAEEKQWDQTLRGLANSYLLAKDKSDRDKILEPLVILEQMLAFYHSDSGRAWREQEKNNSRGVFNLGSLKAEFLRQNSVIVSDLKKASNIFD